MILSLLEYTARRVGIVPEPAGLSGMLLWSAAHASSAATNFTQQLAKSTFVLESGREGDTTTATATVVVGGAARTELFKLSCRAAAAVQKSGAETALVGVRVVTDVKGSVASVVGIASEPQQVTLTAGQAPAVALKVAPNEVWAIGQDGKATLQKATPFVAPHD